MQTSYTFIHLESNHDVYGLLKHICLYIYIYIYNTSNTHCMGVLVISLVLGYFFAFIPMVFLPLVARRSNPGGRKSVSSKVVELPS